MLINLDQLVDSKFFITGEHLEYIRQMFAKFIKLEKFDDELF